MAGLTKEAAMKRATFVVTMMLLLGSASVSAAECAWVLWERVETSKRVSWEATRAFGKEAQCRADQVERIRQLQGIVKDSPNRHVTKDGIRFLKFESGELTGVFFNEALCFPDTIDPREKK